MLIKNCRLINKDGSESIQDISIKNGLIAEIHAGSRSKDTDIIDAKKNYVLPGIVDVHTHMRDMELSHKEDYSTGSMACARGGVTTFIDMPNTIPNTTTMDLLNEKRKKILNNSYVDYGFHFGGSKDNNSDEIDKAKGSCASTKIFMNVSTGNMLIQDEPTLIDIFRHSKIVMVHAEDEMVQKAIDLSEKTGTPVYLCHLSTAKEIDLLKKAKDKGLNVYGEVTPHHLFLNKNDMEQNERSRSLLRMKPELKASSDNKALWEALACGIIDTVGTDHAPHLISEKLSKLTFGIPSVEHSLEMMLNGVLQEKISMKRLIEAMSVMPAKIFRIKNKGGIKIGNDGDLVIIDINDHSPFKNDKIISRSGWTPYENLTRGGKVLTTILRGNIVYSENKFYCKIGKEVSYND